MSGMICEHCGRKEGVVKTKGQPYSGEVIELNFCQDCYIKFIYSKSWIETSRGLVKPCDENLVGTLSVGNWTRLTKIINYVAFIADIILGLIIGGSIGGTISYEEGAVFGGAIIGGLIGLLIGGITIAFSMVFIEMSEKLTSIHKELRNINMSKLTKNVELKINNGGNDDQPSP